MPTDSDPPAGEIERTEPEGELVISDSARELRVLIEGLSPLADNFLERQARSEQEQREHVFRMAQLGMTERLETTKQSLRFTAPLVYVLVAAVLLLGVWAAILDRWEITTHLLTALLAWAAGYQMRK